MYDGIYLLTRGHDVSSTVNIINYQTLLYEIMIMYWNVHFSIHIDSQDCGKEYFLCSL